jgi:hypothetical protein
MGSSSARKRFAALKGEVTALGLVRSGSLVRRYVACGRPSCRCMAETPLLHGPYYEWSGKLGGKTRTLRLSEQQAKLCAEWIGNDKRLKQLLRQMEQLGLEETDRILAAASDS